MDDQEKTRGQAGEDNPAEDDGLIELTDTVDGEASEPDDGHDFIELTEVAEAPPTPEGAVDPTDAQLERVLRKVVKEVYAEKIEGLLLEVVQETVSREIQRIKRLLTDPGKS